MKNFGSTKDIKVGVIGYGGAFNMGRKHLEEMKKAGMTPVCVCELDKARLEVAKQDFPGIQTYDSVAEMLKKSDVNLVVLITPHNTHAPLTLQCLKAGRHVISEKPLAITTADCNKMLAAAQKGELMLSTYHNRHWDGCILRAVKEIKRGIIGDIVRIEAHMGSNAKPRDWWRSSKSISGGILYDWGVHLLEYSLQLIDSEITEVSGFSKTGFWADSTPWKEDTNEDEASAIVRFKSGQMLNLSITSIDANAKGSDRGQLEITGTKGTYIFDGRTWKTVVQTTKGKVTSEGSNPDSKQDAYYKNIAAYLTGKAELIITPEWSRRPIHILDLAVKSAAANKAMKASVK